MYQINHIYIYIYMESIPVETRPRPRARARQRQRQVTMRESSQPPHVLLDPGLTVHRLRLYYKNNENEQKMSKKKKIKKV